MPHGMSHHLTAGTNSAAGLHIVAVACATCQFVNLVLVVSYVVVHLPSEVLRYDRTNGCGELDTLVVQRADVVGLGILEVTASGHIHRVDQVSGLAVVVVEVEGQAVIEQAQVETCVPCGGLLPSEVRVIHIRTIGHAFVAQWIIGISLVGRIGRNPRIVTNTFLLTGLTPAETEFEVIDGLDITQERLIIDTPSKSQRGEQAPTAIFVETGRTIITQREGKHIPI